MQSRDVGTITDMSDSNTPSNDSDPGVIGGKPSAGGPGAGAIKDPDDWVTGDEPLTDAQRSYLETLAREAGETLPGDLTKAEASEHIDRLQSVTGRGSSPSTGGRATRGDARVESGETGDAGPPRD